MATQQQTFDFEVNDFEALEQAVEANDFEGTTSRDEHDFQLSEQAVAGRSGSLAVDRKPVRRETSLTGPDRQAVLRQLRSKVGCISTAGGIESQSHLFHRLCRRRSLAAGRGIADQRDHRVGGGSRRERGWVVGVDCRSQPAPLSQPRPWSVGGGQ